MRLLLLSLLPLAAASGQIVITGGGGGGGGTSTPPASATCVGPGTSCAVDIHAMGLKVLTNTLYACKSSTGADIPVTSASPTGSPNLTSVTLNWTGSLSNVTCAVQAGGSPGTNGKNGLSFTGYTVTFANDLTKTVSAATLTAAGIVTPQTASCDSMTPAFYNDGSGNITLTTLLAYTGNCIIHGGGGITAALSADATLGGGGASDSLAPTQKATKTYADSLAGGAAGPAGGDLSGTYPNPTVKRMHPTVTAVNNAASPYTVLAADTYLSCDATAGAVTITLPAATGTGREISVKKIDSTTNACIPTRAGSDTIDGATSYSLTSQYAASKITDALSGSWQRNHVNQLGGDLSGISSDATASKLNGTTVPTNSAANQTLVTTANATGAWATIQSCSGAGQAVQFNTSTHAYSCIQNGILSATSSGTDVLCSLSTDTPVNGGSCSGGGTGLQTYAQTLTLPVANLAVSRIFRIHAYFTTFSAATQPTLINTIKIGGTVVYANATAALVGTVQSDYGLTIECIVTASSSSNTTLFCAPNAGQAGSGGGARSTTAMPTASLAFGTSSSNQTINITAQFGTSVTGNYVYWGFGYIEQIN